MTLFLSVLKIIGIVLLIILAVVLSLLLIILFVPFRYRIKGEIKADDNYYDFRADVTWFLHLLHGIFTFLKSVMKDECSDKELLEKQGFHYEIRLFGFKIRPREEKEEEAEAEAEYYPAELPSEPAGKREETEPTAENPESRAEAETEPAPENPESRAEAEAEAEAEPSQEASGNTGDTGAFQETSDIPKGFKDRVRDFSGFLRRLFKRAKSLIENAGYKYREICDKIDELKKKALHYYELYNDESTGRAIRLAWNELMRILKALKPRKYSIDILYGFEDPALTGELTGLLSVLFLSSGKRVSLRPDFERSVMEGEIFFKGRIRIITLVIVLWKLYFNKDFRKLYREIRG